MKLLRVLLASVAAALVLTGPSLALAQAPYYPPPGEWERKAPEAVGMDSALLAEAIAFAEGNETTKPMDFSTRSESSASRSARCRSVGRIPTDS